LLLFWRVGDLYKKRPGFENARMRCYPSLLAVYFLATSLAFASSEKLLLELRLDEGGSSTTSSGSIATQVEMLAEGGSAADLHGPEGSGVSGLPADRAFDNTRASRMGGTKERPGQGGALSAPAGDLLRALDSFTLQGWYKAEETPPGSFARLVSSLRVNLYFTQEGLQLKVGNSPEASSALCRSESYMKEGEWIFFAITYNATLPQDNVCFFAGSREEAVKLVQTATLNNGPIRSSGAGTMIFGNTDDGGRPFKGWLDNLRLWGDARGSGGALSEAELELYRNADLNHQTP